MKSITKIVFILLSSFLIIGLLSFVALSGENHVTTDSLNVIKKSSDGTTTAYPDECKTPSPAAGPIPIPYPNIGKTSDTAKGSKKVKTDGNPIQVKDSEYQKTEGDEPGTDSGQLSR
jgi:hypothetical protein